jgi:uncharacterized SAM-binding protein YcdF (DUF218 family)
MVKLVEVNDVSFSYDKDSPTVFENISFSNDIIKSRLKNAKVAFSTTNYHVFRAGAIAHSQKLCFEGIGAKTKSYFWINAFIREYIATLFSEKKSHIFIVFSFMIASIFMVALLYLSNTI